MVLGNGPPAWKAGDDRSVRAARPRVGVPFRVIPVSLLVSEGEAR
ncbi:hypothetical protein RC1_1991 [Rhodospirillum centenum SW]|uniref:Uncharacterized protein n=1 Tax=Rhodospirillum centenum (strain ATCC 51521 / SW) TaxID=414684 RepID=B6INW5_RHOCS|nr:hypothetical protein RC1_1991 [Rhodospirillum centenum SW]